MEHLRILNDLKSRMEKDHINFKKLPKDRRTATHLKVRLENLERMYESYTTKHAELISKYDEEVLEEYTEKDEFQQVLDFYIDYKVDLQNMLSINSTVTVGEASLGSSKGGSLVKLPKIQLPMFNGKYSDWPSFRDLFTSLVHKNTTLDDVQRLHFLKTQLSGEAEQLVRHVPITDANYAVCWNALNKRYNNVRFMSNNIMKRLFGQKNINSESSHALKDLLDTTSECLNELTNLGIRVETWDIIILFVISSKLDAESRKQWELQVCHTSETLPTFTEFKQFLETRFRALEFIEPNRSKPASSHNPKVMHVASTSLNDNATANHACPMCKEDHKLCYCKVFIKEDPDKRHAIVQSLGLCFNCLGGHAVKYCRVSTNCRVCNRKHHSLLHPRKNAAGNTVGFSEAPKMEKKHPPASASGSEGVLNISAHLMRDEVTQVLLATALVRVESNGHTQVLRALLDQGSQASFISESAVQLLRLKKISSSSLVSGVGGDQGVMSRHTVLVNIQSLHDPAFIIQVKAHVLGTLTTVLPERNFNLVDWPDIYKVRLADPGFSSPNKIDILLGAEIYGHVLKEGLLKGPSGSPIAQETHLGWVISGQVQVPSVKCHNVIVSLHTAQSDDTELLRRFWELEAEPVSAKRLLSPEEQACEDHFLATTERDATGRYIVSLPFREEDPLCKYGNSREIAIKRLHGLERKLSKDPSLKKRYSDVITEYLTLGHMEKISEEEDINQPDAVYLPHHAVIREDKTTTKVRVMFDASSKGTNGVSLNETLMIGPTLQPDLRHVVIRWRQHPVCLGADIVKMYRQIKVAETDFQRIVWRDDASKDIEHFRLLRVTFGTSCAPYLAVKALQQTACDEGQGYPLAAEKVLSDFYMDDLMTGCQVESEAIELHHQLNDLLGRGGFELQKWTSNEDAVLDVIRNGSEGNLEIKSDDVTKILGLNWNRSTDEFQYTVKLVSETQPDTKRKVISEISRLYDPLGWIAPCIVTAKVFIQKLWLVGLDWDDELPHHLRNEWQSYRTDLGKLIKFNIPRWLQCRDDDNVVELHGFCDASTVAFAAVVYMRVVNAEGEVHSQLVTAKTKVAPLKQISIPRLELCGAVLLTRLLIEVAGLLSVPKANLHAWTDSSVVLAWLNSYPGRWKTFVANRTSEILRSLRVEQWCHVPSGDNPADCASRGESATMLLDDQLWKQGPTWLCQEPIEYKREPTLTSLEEKSVKVHAAAVNDAEDWFSDMESKFSSLRKLIRVLAYCRRFLQLKLPKNMRSIQPYLTASEISDSLQACIRLCQNRWFSVEISAIKQNKSVGRKSGLMSLNPFLDPAGVMRVGGRIQNADIEESRKHPIIIPHDSPLARLIIADAHVKSMHGGTQLTLNVIRGNYWIVRGKNLVKSYIRDCVRCIRYAGVVKNQLMGQLPSCRVVPSKPFSVSGVDYAGPVNIRVSKGRGNKSYKGYICLFVCMATRAVHIEAVSDLTSQGFLAAFKRFVARRGRCSHLWSDNGSNFIGASKELKILFSDERSSMSSEVAEILANNGTEWHFIPPHAPNFGGLWEAGIKSTKHHLKRVIGDSTLTFEEMSTVLSQVEACLNSRPLCHISDDPNDTAPLTPGHFLVGEQIILPPDYNYENDREGGLRRWQLTQRMVQSFWKRWSQEYLAGFFQRYKWSQQLVQPKVGDMVLVKEDNLPPAKWLYGIVTDLHPGSDGITRVVTLRSKTSVLKRPTSKLCFLPSSCSS